jgi:secreted Zn-dependent insulinase-like peptidase
LKYGVIICPKCGRARGVESVRKTITCQCGRHIKMASMKLRFTTDSPSELAEIVAKVNASLSGAGPMPKPKRKRRADSYVGIVERSRAVKEPQQKMRMIISDLSAVKPEFGAEDIRRIAAILGYEDSNALVDKLLAAGLIYEVSSGRFRAA